MVRPTWWGTPAMALVFLLGLTTSLEAARIRYHCAPIAPGDSRLRPMSPGERLTWFRGWEPYTCPPPPPTHTVTFRHPASGKPVTVFLSLPYDSTPLMQYRTNYVIYNYGTYAVEIHFLPNGLIDVIYETGLFHAP